jgi:hypothetical protein
MAENLRNWRCVFNTFDPAQLADPYWVGIDVNGANALEAQL